MSILCSMVGATFGVAAAAEVIRYKKGITAIGNAQIDTAQSKFGGSSYLGDGTGDYLIVKPPFELQGSDFTMEAWVNPDVSTERIILAKYSNTYPNGFDWTFNQTSTGKLIFQWYDSTFRSVVSTGSLSTATWTHVAVVRNGSSLKLYINGTNDGTGTISANIRTGSLSPDVYVGAYFDGSVASSWDGWMDEIRVSNSARYTANFTAPTTPFVNDSNTLLLIHADGTDATTYFEDDNGVIPVSTRTARTVTASGNAQIDTAQYKYGSSALLCDGTGDYLTATSASNFNFGSGDFTLEFWMRANNFSSIRVPFASRGGAGIGNGDWWCELGTNGKIYWGFKNQAGTQYYANLSQTESAFSTGVWYHIALVRSGTSVTYYRDGVATGGATTVTGSFGGNDNVYIGALGPGGYSFDGWIDEVRISNNARYTANFNPIVNNAFINDANTLLLLHMEGTDASTTFTDDVVNSRNTKAITAFGNAQIDNAQSKFGNTSLALDGTGDYLRVTSSSDFAFGNSNWTIECWIRTTNVNTTQSIFDFRNNNGDANAPYAYLSNQNVYYGEDGANRITSGAVITSTTVWYHFVVVRNGNTITLYTDGTSRGTYTTAKSHGTSYTPVIGDNSYGSAYWNGWIDEFRISNIARYTAAFTSPTSPFVNDLNTVLLIHMDGTDGSTVFLDDSGYNQRTAKHISYAGSTAISHTQSKFNGSSVYFDGTGSDRLYFPSGSDVYMLPSGNAKTFECWVYINNLASMSRNSPNHLPALMGQMDTNGNINWTFGPNSAGGLTIYWWSGGNNWYHSSTTNLAINTWYHLALVMDGTSLKGYVNGTEYVSATIANTPTTNVPTFFIGTEYTTTINAYVDEFRISNSVRYTGNFTAPTTAFTNDANTVLLLHFNAANSSTVFEDDIGGRTRLNAQGVNNAQLSSAQSKFGGTSLLTDGVDDRVIVPYNNKLMFGTGDFTIEFWMRPIALTTGNDMMMDFRLNSGDNTIVIFTSNKVIRYYVGADRIIGSTLNNNQWYHIAVSRSSNSTKMFIDGTQVGSTYTDNNNLFVSSAGLWIGDAQPFAGQGEYNGYMDEIRISNSARYTANFTPPTEPFSNDANTVLLLHMDGTSGSTVFIDDNGQIPVSGA